jgi:hypothetical protein
MRKSCVNPWLVPLRQIIFEAKVRPINSIKDLRCTLAASIVGGKPKRAKRRARLESGRPNFPGWLFAFLTYYVLKKIYFYQNWVHRTNTGLARQNNATSRNFPKICAAPPRPKRERILGVGVASAAARNKNKHARCRSNAA